MTLSFNLHSFSLFCQNDEPGRLGPKGAKGHRGPEGRPVRMTLSVHIVVNECVKHRFMGNADMNIFSVHIICALD